MGPSGPRRRYNRDYERGLGIVVVVGVVVLLFLLIN